MPKISISLPERPANETWPPEVMIIDRLASNLQLSKSSLYKLAQDGRVPGQKVGRHWRLRKEVIDRWLDSGGGGPESNEGAA